MTLVYLNVIPQRRILMTISLVFMETLIRMTMIAQKTF